MNVLIVGGSNSRLKQGYTSSLKSNLELMGRNIDLYTNISLGANTCLLGIFSLFEIEGNVDYDLIVLEYSVNDYSMTARGDYDLWRTAYEGLVRLVLRRWPKARLCCVLLGRSNVNKVLWDKQIEQTKIIANNYNAIIVDAQSYIPSIIDANDLYADPMHYSQSAQGLVGIYAAQLIVGNNSKTLIENLPQACYSSAFDKIDLLDIADARPLGEKKVFQNSVVKINTTKIGASDFLEIDIPGQLVCVMFVSSKESGSFQVSCNEDVAVVHTLHDGVRDGKYEFLPLTVYSPWWNQKNKGGKFIFNVCPLFLKEADWPIFHTVPSKSPEPVVYLSKALFLKNPENGYI